VGPLFILKGIDLFSSKFFGFGFGTSIDGGKQGRSLARAVVDD